jgi:hypothetical protein
MGLLFFSLAFSATALAASPFAEQQRIQLEDEEPPRFRGALNAPVASCNVSSTVFPERSAVFVCAF